MDSDIIQDSEYLFHGLGKNVSNDCSELFVSPAFFLNANGLIVDRSGDRSIRDVVKSLRARFKDDYYCSIVCSVKKCKEKRICIKSDATECNKYQAVLYGNNEKGSFSLLQAIMLADIFNTIDFLGKETYSNIISLITSLEH